MSHSDDEWVYDEMEMIDHRYGSAERTEVVGEDDDSLNSILESFGMQSSRYTIYEYVRTKERKIFLVELKGGRCEKCGYDKSMSALDFHHVDPAEKRFGICQACLIFSDLSFKELVIPEVGKCRLLCSNCHREEHADGRRLRRRVQ